MSSASVTNMMNQTQGLSSSSMRIEEETMLMMMQKENQGIVTILGSGCCDTYTTSSASSLRRTFSADMSSKNWFSHNNNKTISTSSSSSSSEGEEEYEEMKKEEFDAEAEAERERLEIWSSILRNKQEEQEKSSSPFDTWGTIMNLKGNNEISKSLPLTPYVHPLVKRSKSSLNQKSLEICTESLGSETGSGSDGMLFSSSYPSSDSEDNRDREQRQEEQIVKVNESAYEAEQDWYNNHHAITTKKSSPPRSFPPPLPSLSLQANNKNGASLHMRPHRDNGRLVLEAVSLPSQNNFNAQRQDGRLVLTFTDGPAAAAAYDDMAEENYDIDEGVEDLEEEFEGFEEDDGGDYDDDDDDEVEDEDEEEEEEEEGVEVVNVESVMMEKESSNLLSSNVHRLTLMMNKSIGLVKNNRNQNWSEKFNKKGVNLEEVSLVKMEPTSAVAQSLTQTVGRLIPSSASAASAATATSFNFNAYEYYWRTNPTTTEAESDYKAIHNQHNSNYYPSSQHHNKMNNYGSKVIVSTNEHQHQQQLLVLRGKNGDYLVHNLKTCKDSRRPFLFWEPYCIATS